MAYKWSSLSFRQQFKRFFSCLHQVLKAQSQFSSGFLLCRQKTLTSFYPSRTRKESNSCDYNHTDHKFEFLIVFSSLLFRFLTGTGVRVASWKKVIFGEDTRRIGQEEWYLFFHSFLSTNKELISCIFRGWLV